MSQPTVARAEAVAKKRFGFPGLRPLQKDVLSHILAGEDTLAVLPTGGGKSLTFILPALLFDGISIVISPLKALMKDQVSKLIGQGVKACQLTSDMPETYLATAMADLSKFDIIYISPEKAVTREFLKALTGKKVSMIATDESHVVASLYSTFRASCAHLEVLYDAHDEAVRIAVTATADPHIEEDIQRICCLRNPARIVASPWRDNIAWKFVKRSTEDAQYVADAICEQQEGEGSQIIYTASRSTARALADYLHGSGLSAECYHAGMVDRERKAVQEAFMSGETRCIVATSAFGMGVDKSDIRFVLNWEMPATLFDLLQQGGRASRDGAPAVCVSNIGKGADKVQRFFHTLTHPDWPVYRRLWEAFTKSESPVRWRGDKLVRIAKVGDRMAGQVDAAVSYMEFRRQIRTSPAGHVYVFSVRDAAKARRMCAATGSAYLDAKGENLTYTVPFHGQDLSKHFTDSRACWPTEPIESVVVTPLVPELEITDDDVVDRYDRAVSSLEAIYEFSESDDQQAFVENLLLK